MKRLFISAIVAAVAMSCANEAIDDAVDSPLTDESACYINVCCNENADTRVTLTEDSESGNLITTWVETLDFLGVWSDGYTFEGYGYVESVDSDDKSLATIKIPITTTLGETIRLFFPYQYGTAATIIDNKRYIGIQKQTIDISDRGLYSIGTYYTNMVSDECYVSTSGYAPSTVVMRHIGTAIKLGLRFENVPSDGLTIESLMLGGGDGVAIPYDAYFDYTKDVTVDDDYLTSITSGYLNVTVSNSPTIAEFSSDDADGTTYYIYLNAFPFTIAANQSIELSIKLRSESGGQYSGTYTVTNGDVEKEISRATYTSINYLCDLDLAESNYWSSKAADSFAGGDGSATTPYLISTPEQLAKLAVDVSNKTTYKDKYFELTNNIDLSGNYWYPIGVTSYYDAFFGVFDGKGYEVSGLEIDDSLGSYQALFGAIYAATVQNLGVSGSVVGNMHVGGVVGFASYSKVLYCYNKADVEGDYNVGGVVGYTIQSSIISCYNSGSIADNGTLDDSSYIGGIVGYYNSGGLNVISCYNSGSVYSSGYAVGGIIGHVNGYNAVLSNCYNSGTVASGTSTIFTKYSAALVGGCSTASYTTITGSHWLDTSSDRAYYYAVTIGDDSYAVNDETLKSTDFLEKMNGYTTTYNEADPTYPALGWIVGTDGYPTIDYPLPADED
ncbi:MAG: GLUG motif-containing protein [Rikenellaceae bacterium]